MQVQHGAIATTTETKLISVHVHMDWADSAELEIEIKREAV
jgi:hypothetical protein